MKPPDLSRNPPGSIGGPIRLETTDADTIWRYDLMDDLGSRPHDAASCSVLIHLAELAPWDQVGAGTGLLWIVSPFVFQIH